MATIAERKRKDGKKTYCVQIRHKGYPHVSLSFSTRGEAEEWISQNYSQILNNPEQINKIVQDKRSILHKNRFTSNKHMSVRVSDEEKALVEQFTLEMANKFGYLLNHSVIVRGIMLSIIQNKDKFNFEMRDNEFYVTFNEQKPKEKPDPGGVSMSSRADEKVEKTVQPESAEERLRRSLKRKLGA